jgi:hypothetical protein
MKTSIELLVLSCIVVLFTVLWAPSAYAFPGFDDGGGEGVAACAGCHTELANFGPQHGAHAALSNDDCSSCHGTGSQNNPPLSNCVRCHGRDEDAGGDGEVSAGLGRGLRQHHVTAGAAACGNCHDDATGPAGVGENVLPSFYSLALGGAGLDSCDGSEEVFPSNSVSLDNDGDGLTDSADPDCALAPPDEFLHVGAMANFNGNNKTDLGVLLRDSDTGKNNLYVMDGGNAKKLATVSFGTQQARGFTTVHDGNGDLVPEFGVLLEGSLFARVKDIVNRTLLGKPNFNANFDPVAFLSVGDAGAGIGPDVAVVGYEESTGKVQAQVKDVVSGGLVRRISFSETFVPFDAVALDNVGDSNAMDIAVLGIDASGNVQAQVKDALSGKLVSKFSFNKKFTPLFFAAVPNAAGKLKYLAVLGRNASGVIQAQIKRAANGALVSNVRFSKTYDPKAFISFADSNGSGGGEIAVVGVNDAGKVRAQAKEIADGTAVKNISFSASYPPLDAIAINGVAGTGRNEIAVLGEKNAGEFRLQIKDLLSGDLVKNIPLP